MSTPVTSPVSRPVPLVPEARAVAVDHLLDRLDALVTRNRALAPEPVADQDLHLELIGAEIAHELAIAKAALRSRLPG